MERRLGLRLPRDTTYVVTKIGTDLDSLPPRKRFDLDHLRPAFERSRERLGRDKLDVVLLHNPTMHAMGDSEPFDFLKELKRLGALRAWGVSAGNAQVARAAIAQGAEVVELAYNVFCSADLHEVADALSESRRRGAGPLGARARAARRPVEQRTASSTRATTAAIGGPSPSCAAASASSTPSARSSTAPSSPLRAAALRFVLANQLVTSAVLGPALGPPARAARPRGRRRAHPTSGTPRWRSSPPGSAPPG